MKRPLLTIALALAFIFGYAVAGSMADEIMAKSEEKSGACNLLGASVKDSQGEFLGVISDFVKEPDRRVTFAILNFGKAEDYEDGGRNAAIPFGTLSCAGQECTLDSTYEKLAASPIFLSKDELTERKMAEDIHRYYGVTPPWIEEQALELEMGLEY